MANELHDITSITPPQDSQPLQVNIQVPKAVNAERSNSGNSIRSFVIGINCIILVFFVYLG